MADKRTDTEKLDEAVEAALVPNGPAVKDRDPDGQIHVGETEVAEVEVTLVDAGYDVPEVEVARMDKRHPDPEVGVVVPAEGLGSLALPLHSFLDAKRPEDVFAEDDAPEITDEDRTEAASSGRSARAVADAKKADGKS